MTIKEISEPFEHRLGIDVCNVTFISSRKGKVTLPVPVKYSQYREILAKYKKAKDWYGF